MGVAINSLLYKDRFRERGGRERGEECERRKGSDRPERRTRQGGSNFHLALVPALFLRHHILHSKRKIYMVICCIYRG